MLKPIEFEISANALKQIELLMANDFTLADMSLRISIKGKECDGFRYALGFDTARDDDVRVSYQVPNQVTDMACKRLEFIFDPFTYEFAHHFKIDFHQEPIQTEHLEGLSPMDEGFVVENQEDGRYRGKFFKNEENVPENLRKL